MTQKLTDNRKKFILDELKSMNIPDKLPKWYVYNLKCRIINRLVAHELPIITNVFNFCVSLLIIILASILLCLVIGYCQLSIILAFCGSTILMLMSCIVIVIRNKKKEVEPFCNEMIEDKIQN